MSGLSTFRIGGAAPAEQPPKGALRLGTVRFLPRGMSVAERKLALLGPFLKQSLQTPRVFNLPVF